MPEDVDAIVPICLQSGSYTKGQVGSRLGQARIQCGHISMNLNEEASNIGGQAHSSSSLLRVISSNLACLAWAR